MRYALLCAILVSFYVNAQDTPRRKAGLWEVTMRMAEMPKPLVMQQCVDEKSDDLARQQGRGKSEMKMNIQARFLGPCKASK